MNNDLISREALKENKFVGVQTDNLDELPIKAYQQGWNDAIDTIIDNAPTVPLPDFKEGYKQAIRDGKTNFSKPQGKWITTWERYIFQCSCCHGMSVKYNFCPNCGADMREAE